MRRLPPTLVVCALLTACAADPPPDTIPIAVPRWTASIPLVPPSLPSPSASPSPPATPAPVPAPAGRAAAVRSPLYAVGKAKAHCDVPVIKTRSWPSMRRYMRAVSSCMDRIWARRFGVARLEFTPPRRAYLRRQVYDDRCGEMPADEAAGTYCDAARKYYVIVDGPDLGPWSAAWQALVIGHEYGHHVQNLAGISQYESELAFEATTRGAEDLASRRLELQAECFSGVAVRAMGAALPPRRVFQEQYTGTAPKRWDRDHGLLATQRRWFERGVRSGSPGACDTWSAPKREVT